MLYDTFVKSSKDIPSAGEKKELVIRSLADGPHKYEFKFVEAQISEDATDHPDELLIRVGMGQTLKKSYFLRIVRELQRI